MCWRGDGGIQPANLQLLRETWTNALFRAGSPLCVCVCWSSQLLSKFNQSQSPPLSLTHLDRWMNDGWMDGWMDEKAGQIKRKEIEREMNEWLKVQGVQNGLTDVGMEKVREVEVNGRMDGWLWPFHHPLQCYTYKVQIFFPFFSFITQFWFLLRFFKFPVNHHPFFHSCSYSLFFLILSFFFPFLLMDIFFPFPYMNVYVPFPYCLFHSILIFLFP